jgi:hypothetical protein
MLKHIFVDSNNRKNYCQLVSDLGRPVHSPLALFPISAELEPLEREWSEFTASLQLLFDPPHAVIQALHLYILYLSELVKNALMISVYLQIMLLKKLYH